MLSYVRDVLDSSPGSDIISKMSVLFFLKLFFFSVFLQDLFRSVTYSSFVKLFTKKIFFARYHE